MKKEVGLVVIAVFLCTGLSYGASSSKKESDVEEIDAVVGESEKKEASAVSLNEAIVKKDKEIAEKNAIIEKLKLENIKISTELGELKKKLAEMDKQAEDLKKKQPASTSASVEIDKLKIENTKLSTELAEVKKKMEEMSKQSEVASRKQSAPPPQEKVDEIRKIEEIINQGISRDVKVFPCAEGLKLMFSSDIFFQFDSLTPGIYGPLDLVIKALKVYPQHKIFITGYTDNSGDRKTNLKASLARAKAVTSYLISQGIPEEKLTVRGLGTENPFDTNLTKEGRQQNRRVEIIILK